MKNSYPGKGTRLVPVIIDGNNHNITKDGKPVCIKTEITDNIVTLAKCQEITAKIKALGHNPKNLKFLLSIYTETPGNEYGDMPEECLLDKTVCYYPAKNLLRVWGKGMPVYENYDGLICNDPVALADCLYD